MKRRNRAFSVAFQMSLLTLFLGAAARASEEIELCDFKVPVSVANANASFSVIYTIQVGQDGNPVRVTKIKNEFLEDAPFVKCLNNWKLPPEYGTMSVVFNWEHGKGWTEMSLGSKGVNRVLRFQAGWCTK